MLAYSTKSYKDTCPKCGGSNLYCTPHNKKRFCFNCRYYEYSSHSKHIPLVRSKYLKEIRELYTELAQVYHSNLRKQDRQYLHQRGINDASIEQFKIGYCAPDILLHYKNKLTIEAGIATTEGKPFLSNRITFPYFVDNLVTDIRGRTTIDTQEPKYKSLYQSAYYRGADFPFNYNVAYSDTIVVTEGELKAIASQQAGVDCIALPGMGNWRKGYIPYQHQKGIICYDNTSNKGRAELINAILRTSEHFVNLCIATLPLRGKDKMDIDTYILEYSVKEYKRVINGALDIDEWRALIR